MICAILLFGLSRSAIGLILQASGQDTVGAQALGFNVTRHKLVAFCISAVFSGVAGAMLVFYQGTASVSTVVDLSVGVQIIIAAVLGGRRTILGAVLGSICLIVAGDRSGSSTRSSSRPSRWPPSCSSRTACSATCCV
jgi:branched-chain amino acid transport system permease protein